MKRQILLIFAFAFPMFLLLGGDIRATLTIEQKLTIISNAERAGGELKIAVQLKGTNLTEASTLGSATIDISYDKNVITYTGASDWAYGGSDGYSRFISNITDPTPQFVRLGTTGMSVNENTDGTPAGYNVKSEYETIVILTFTIVDPAADLALTVITNTNQIGLFNNPSNNPRTGIIENKDLSTPVNIEGTPLPVELKSFSALQQGGEVQLKWVTSTEINSYGFEVERAFATKKETGEKMWVKTGFLPASGNSNSEKTYLHSEKLLASGKYLFRLKEIDIDGQYKYSDDIEIDFTMPLKFELEQNYPNPFNPNTAIRFSIEKPAVTILNIYNTIGEKVKTLNNKFLDAGTYTFNFDASGFQSGIYLYELISGNSRHVKKMILLK